MIHPARSTLRPPGATHRTQRMGHEYSGYLLHTPRQISRLGSSDAASSGAQELRDRWGVLPPRFIPLLSPAPSSARHPTGYLHRTNLLAPSFPMLLLQPSQEDSPWRQGQVVGRTPWSPRTVLDLPSPPCSQEPLKQREGESFPALTEVLPARDRKSLPSLERRRPHATQR